MCLNRASASERSAVMQNDGRRIGRHAGPPRDKRFLTSHMFRKESDFEAFERVMVEAHLRQMNRVVSLPQTNRVRVFTARTKELASATDARARSCK